MEPNPLPGHATAARSRFSPSRFGQGRGGAWLDHGKPDAGGRSAGAYRTGNEGGSVDSLTIVRPVAAPPASAQPPAPRALQLPGGRSGVLLFHGLATTPAKLQFIARGLHRAGYTVRVPAIEGYTRGAASSGAADHRAWAEAALAEFDRMREQCDTLAVGGLCVGSVLALHIAAHRGDRVSHVLALSTTLHFDGWAAPRSRWLLPLARVIKSAGRIPVKEREPYGVKDERLRAWIAAQLKEAGTGDEAPIGMCVADLLEAQRLMSRVRQEIRAVRAPTLLVHARDDDMASPRSAFEVASGVSSEKVNCVLLNDSYHLIAIDKEKARVLAEMKLFLQGIQPPDGTGPAPVQTSNTRSSEHVHI